MNTGQRESIASGPNDESEWDSNPWAMLDAERKRIEELWSRYGNDSNFVENASVYFDQLNEAEARFYESRPTNWRKIWTVKDEYITNTQDLKKLELVDQLTFLLDVGNSLQNNNFLYKKDVDTINRNIQDDDDFCPMIQTIAAKLNYSADDIEGTLGKYREDYFGYYDLYSSRVFITSFSDYSKMSKEELKSELALEREKHAAILRELEEKSEAARQEGSYSFFGADQQEESKSRLRCVELENEMMRLSYAENKARLHREFPFLSENQNAIKMASDAVAVVKFDWEDSDSPYDPIVDFYSPYTIDSVYNKEGDLVFTSNNEKSNEIRQGIKAENSMSYLEMVHSNKLIRDAVEDAISQRLGEIPLESQLSLIKFMTEANNDRFGRLCETLHEVDEKLRLKLLENFVAADFGEDFGDSLLTIADSESLSSEEKERILDQIGSCRESISKITGLYDGIDEGVFAKQYARATNERLTDAIMAFSQIAEGKSAKADLDWVGEIDLDYDSAIEALEYETKSLEIISGTFEDVVSGAEGAYAERFMSPDESHNRSFYNLFSPSHGHVLLYTRPEGSGEFDPSIEYGKYRSAYSEEENVGVEASISMIANPVQPFELPVPFRPTRRVMRMLGGDEGKIERIRNKVSAIRLDREGRAPNGATRNVGRDPINPIGTISVDLAAILDDGDTPSGKIARLFSAGNKIRAEKQGESEYSLNHNTNWFDQDKYGTSDGFSRLVNYIDSQMAGLCAVYPPKPGEGMTGEMKAKQRRRYKKMGGGTMGRAA